ncbi:fungal chitosanase of glycosyl hydrolase group 75-domain-containing protein [Aspergillus terricola var. indicus]
MPSNKYFRLVTVLFFSTSVLCQTIDGSNDDYFNEGPPASYFSAAPTMPVAALQSAASRLGRTSHGGSFRVSSDSGERSSIYSDWASFNEGAAVVWAADMDVDCDGIDYGCKGNPDGRPETSWGALSAYEVPFIVIPEDYLNTHEAGLRGNNIAAVICNGNMFYGILGDTNGDSPEVTGEASWLMARTCFPTEGLSGATGHNDADVIYIVFLGEDAVLPASAMNGKYITDFDTLREMGDALVNALVSNIGLGSGDGMGARTRFRHPSFKAVDATTSTRRTASILTARSWNITSRLLEPSTASCSPASGCSVPPSPPIASASTPVTSSSSAVNPSSSSAASENPAVADSAGSSTSPSNMAPNVAASAATSSSGPAGASASIGTAPNRSAPGVASPSIPAASVTTPSASASSSIPPSHSAAASDATPGPSSAAGNASTPAGSSASVPTPLSVPPSQAASNTATPSASLNAGAASPPSVASPSDAAASNPATPPSSATSAAAVSSAPSPPTPTPSCSWPGHCLGAPCSTLDDCSNDLVCVNGLCAVDQDVVLGSISSPTGTPAARRWITAVRGDRVR